MRFRIVTTFYPPSHFGGDAVFVQQLSTELAKRGHDAEVVHCKDTFNLVGTRQQMAAGKTETHPNVRTHTLDSSFGLLSPLATQQTGRPFFQSVPPQPPTGRSHVGHSSRM
jgi:hypothetical protein